MILRDVSLKRFNTFGLNYKADYLLTLESEEEAISFVKSHALPEAPLLILGGGSNLLFTNDFHGTIIHPAITGIVIEEQNEDHVIVSSGAGTLWDDLVEWSVQRGYGGLENMSLIPGLVGASPVQNIGAYGAEVREVIVKVRTISMYDGTIKEFRNDECKFNYRDSVFKREFKGKYLITRVFFKLATQPALNTEYDSLWEEAEKLGPLSIRTVRDAVIKKRRYKLPDPKKTGNAGSFFKNPVVEPPVADGLLSKFPGIPWYIEKQGKRKIAAGWLIDQCGWKGKRIGNAGVHDKQALVLVNFGKATGKEIFELSEAIKKSVIDKFGIELQREVEVIGSI
jgi:UDP-N-acetylmuramate dehydrogenase